jgi:hypothetical protein
MASPNRIIPRVMGVADASADPCIVGSAVYEDGRRVGEVAIDDVSDVLEHGNQFVWIGLHDPSGELLRKVQEEFGLHDLAVEDAPGAPTPEARSVSNSDSTRTSERCAVRAPSISREWRRASLDPTP